MNLELSVKKDCILLFFFFLFFNMYLVLIDNIDQEVYATCHQNKSYYIIRFIKWICILITLYLSTWIWISKIFNTNTIEFNDYLLILSIIIMFYSYTLCYFHVYMQLQFKLQGYFLNFNSSSLISSEDLIKQISALNASYLNNLNNIKDLDKLPDLLGTVFINDITTYINSMEQQLLKETPAIKF